jgi:hypothetical protein
MRLRLWNDSEAKEVIFIFCNPTQNPNPEQPYLTPSTSLKEFS